MCIIAVKPKGVKMPPQNYIENMWWHNNDGAGFMYADGKQVIIRKGYMTITDFNHALEKLGKERDLTNTALIMHFRIGTAGGNIPENTHPFPITDSIPILQKLSCSTQLGIAHNGVISITPRTTNISDTMEWIAAELAPLYRYDKNFYTSKDVLQALGARTKSKLAFMDSTGVIFTVGAFVEENGILYSNTSYSYQSYYRNQYARYYYPTEAYSTKSWKAADEGAYVDKLMMLQNGAYIVDYETGNYYDSDIHDLFIDEDGFVYVYDDFLQCAMPLNSTYTAFTKDGLTVKFDPSKAADMLIDGTMADMEDYEDDDLILDEKDEEAEKKEDPRSFLKDDKLWEGVKPNPDVKGLVEPF